MNKVFFIYLVVLPVVFYRACVTFPDYFLVAATIHTSLVSFESDLAKQRADQ